MLKRNVVTGKRYQVVQWFRMEYRALANDRLHRSHTFELQEQTQRTLDETDYDFHGGFRQDLVDREKVYSVFNKKTSKFELTFRKPFSGYHIDADLGALGATDINNATVTLQTYLPSSPGDSAIRFNLTTVAGTLGTIDRASFQKIRLANDKTTRLEDFITLKGNVVNPQMIITPKPSHASVPVDSLARFQSRITPIIHHPLNSPVYTTIVDLQYTDTFFVILLDDYQTIILNQYADTNETT
jgi:hypothetical protein